MISTGSMAPGLLGYHKRVTCPTCNYEFSHGVPVDTPSPDETEVPPAAVLTHCPNCGQDRIDISQVPRNQGDQLLVNKHAFQLHAPRRWEVVVFKNPHNATQVYVKRIVGLPLETVQVIDGDVFINNRRSRKTMAQQRAIRIPVYDHDFEPRSDLEWQPRWVADRDASWQRHDRGFVFRPERAVSQQPLTATMDWIDYRHWRRSGGSHRTTIPLAVAPPELDQRLRAATIGQPLDATHRRCPVSWDRSGSQLICTGVMDRRWRDKLLTLSTDANFQSAVRVLHEESHIGQISSSNGYNHHAHLMPTTSLRDVMISLNITLGQVHGQLAVRFNDMPHRYTCVLDFDRSRLALLTDSQTEPLRQCALPEPARVNRYLLEVSLFDRQFAVAVDGQDIVASVALPPAADEADPAKVPIQIGGLALDARIDKLQTFCDVYYTRGKAINGIDQPHVLAQDEYFMLGDNSAVSADSRNWPQGSVQKRLLVGKPFVVHLPSRPGKLRIGGSWTHFRIPDFSRVRYIR
ncbi:MAG: signal peptidase I [Planctomycetaceae bacterium]